jgi:undecaprenyl-diphosphatase
MIFCASYLVYIVFLVVAICLAYLVAKREWRPVIYFMATLAVTFILLQLMAMLNFDHRPFMDHRLTQLVAHASGKSFPSDHTTVTAGIAFGLLFFTRFKKLGVVVLAAACLIGFARIFVGIHYPLDILGGLVTGLLGGAFTFGVYKLIENKQKPGHIAPEA